MKIDSVSCNKNDGFLDENESENEDNYNTNKSEPSMYTIKEDDKEYDDDSSFNDDNLKNSESDKNDKQFKNLNEEDIVDIKSTIWKDKIFKEDKENEIISKIENVNFDKINLETLTYASTTNKSQIVNLQSMKIHTYPQENYEGEVDENYARNGYGIYEYNNGDIYEGDFLNGTRHGEGEYTYFDGSIYRGHWINDNKHGRGTFKFDKYEFEGEWEEDFLKEGFTFKINQFDNNKSISDEDISGNGSLSNIEEVDSNEFLIFEHDKIQDFNYLRNFVNDNYRVPQREKFIFDDDQNTKITETKNSIQTSKFAIDDKNEIKIKYNDGIENHLSLEYPKKINLNRNSITNI